MTTDSTALRFIVVGSFTTHGEPSAFATRRMALAMSRFRVAGSSEAATKTRTSARLRSGFSNLTS